MHAPRFRCEEDADLWWDDKIDAAKEKAIDMKYKIQVPALDGWADLKVTEDDGKTYAVEVFDTAQEADAELGSLQDEIPNFEGRVVPEDTEPTTDLY
jgi:hypothetical protein